MSQENVEIAKRCLEAFDRGDYDDALASFDENVEYDLRHLPEGRIYRGPEGIREAFRIWMGTWTDYRQEREIIDAGDSGVLTPTREYGRGKSSGVSLSRETCGQWVFRDGKVIAIRFYSNKAEALDAVGLSE